MPLHGINNSSVIKRIQGWSGIGIVSLLCCVGVGFAMFANAASIPLSLEPESASVISPATTILDNTASGGKSIKFGADTPQNPYRPIRITDPKQLPHAPQDARYVMWNFPAGTMLYDAFKTLGPNDILVLPERAEPYEIDSRSGFVSDTDRWYAMARSKRGLVGLGPGVIVQPSASSFSLPRSTSAEGNQNTVLQSVVDGSYFGNFEMRGRTFGSAAYDAIKQSGNNAVWERIYFNGAHRGWRNLPPGETAAVAAYQGNNPQVYNVEIDCRDPATGTRVGTSPLMFNAQSNVVVQDVYAHHAYSGMPTFWKVTNITTTRLRSEHNGSGSGDLSGSGINHEQVAGTVTHNDPTLIIDYGHPNTGLHISVGDAMGADYYINRPIVDAGPAGEGIFTMQIWGSNPPADAKFHITNSTGGAMPFRTYK